MTTVKMSKTENSGFRNILISLVSGATAGAIAKTTIAPLDRTKINFQVDKQKYSTRAAFRFILRSYRNDGFLSLWRGNSATMARIVPYAAIQFSSHEQWKRLLDIESSKTQRFLAGSLAGVTSQTLTYPLDLARARMAVAPKNTYGSLKDVFKGVWVEEGTLGFYRGYIPTILGVIPYAGVSFYTYGTLKKWINNHYKTNNAFTNLMCGAVAGMLGQTSSYPLDIVRRRMQVCILTKQDCHSVKNTLVTVYNTEGIMGLFKGLSMNWIKGPIAVGISFATYEHINCSLKRFVASD